MKNIKYCALHTHTEFSNMDSVMRIEDVIDAAKEMNAPAAAISDHGTMAGCVPFYLACKGAGIAPVIGCEYYVDSESGYRKHLCVYAKDTIGYQAMMKAVMLSNKNITKTGKLVFPKLTREMIMECFGPESKGYGHVVATSACIQGVIAGLAVENKNAKNAAESIESEVSNYEVALNQVKESEEQLNALKNSDDPNKDKRVAYFKGQLKDAKEIVKKGEANYNALKAKYDNLSASICESDNDLAKKMEQEALVYQEIFGKGNFFIELQYHGMEDEEKWFSILDKIAERNDIPTVAANDAHMKTNSERDIEARETVKSLRFYTIDKTPDSEKELYIKSDDELAEAISNVTSNVEKAMDGVRKIYEMCKDAVIPMPEKLEDKHYPAFIKGADSYELLKQAVQEGIKIRFPNGFPDHKLYVDRLNYEIKTMKQMGVCDYILIVQDLLQFGRKLGHMPVERYEYLNSHIWDMTYDEIVAYVDEDQSYIGYLVGPGRGSSAGSLICYCVGITDIDPIPYGLLFERFLNPERVSMPDIDSDYGKGYRDTVVAYTYKKYGENAVCRIITYGTASAKAAIKGVAKSIGTTNNTKESYDALGQRLSDVIPKKPHALIADSDDKFLEMSNKDKRVSEIISRAKSIEGTKVQTGMHACGVIISDNDNVNEYVPLAWDSKNKVFKCQCTATEAEAQGLLKMDYLGLKNLNMITEIIRMIHSRTGIVIDPSTIPVESEVIREIAGNARTNSIFQLESKGMKDICQRMKPDTFEDIILLVAAYRPGPMESIPKMISVKNGLKAEYDTPELEHILNVTYGVPIYQEQVQQIFRDLAGYSYGQADNVRRAMAKKKEKVLLAERESFISGDEKRGIAGCVANGISAEAANKIFDSMVSFASYAFNKSHAAAYARVSYILMWLKYHYFSEFMAVALKWSNQKKIVGLLSECKEQGIEVTCPDINVSESGFVIDGNKIVYGLASVKGIVNIDNIIEERKKGPFLDFEDYLNRTKVKRNVTQALIDTGAFDRFGVGRSSLSRQFASLFTLMTALQDAQDKVKDREDLVNILEAGGTRDDVFKFYAERKIKRKSVFSLDREKNELEKAKKKVDEIKELLTVIDRSDFGDNLEDNLKLEKDLLGVYLSGHPTDNYIREGSSIERVEKGKDRKIFGVITNLNIRNRKSDGADMAFFDLEDTTGSIECKCFVNSYKENKENIYEGAVVVITGYVNEEEIFHNTNNPDGTYDADDDENSEDDAETVETKTTMTVNVVKKATKREKRYVLDISSFADWHDIWKYVVPYYTTDESCGIKLLVRTRDFNGLKEAKDYVSESILADSNLKSYLMLI